MKLNQVTLAGNVGRDAEMRYTPSGAAVTTFSLAVSESKKNDAGEWEDGDTLWVTVVAWNELAERLADDSGYTFAHKGRNMFVQGRLRHRKYERKDGTEGWALEVIANIVKPLDKSEGQASNVETRYGEPPARRSNQTPDAVGAGVSVAPSGVATSTEPDYDDLPF